LKIAAVGRALPEHRYDQRTIEAALLRIWPEPEIQRRLPALHDHARVQYRHLALPLERYADLGGFGSANDQWIEVGLALGEQAARDALARARLVPEDVDAIFCVSVTGIASPSLDARLCNRMRLRSDVKRVPIFGLGCVAGAAGIARAADYLRAFPEQVALLVAVELCSLTFQRDDRSAANLVASALFGDGAAAVVVTGAGREHRGPAVAATRSIFYADTEEVMGWRVTGRGFQLVLSADVPRIARERLAADVDGFLAAQGLQRRDIAAWICHPGGPKVLEAMQQGLGLSDAAVAHAWRMLEEQGNLSSASVLMVLRETMAAPPKEGSWGLLLAMGPGFCSELVLLRF
jgi:alkylresorcinol/alkylpyrone synthase